MKRKKFDFSYWEKRFWGQGFIFVDTYQSAKFRIRREINAILYQKVRGTKWWPRRESNSDTREGTGF